MSRLTPLPFMEQSQRSSAIAVHGFVPHSSWKDLHSSRILLPLSDLLSTMCSAQRVCRGLMLSGSQCIVGPRKVQFEVRTHFLVNAQAERVRRSFETPCRQAQPFANSWLAAASIKFLKLFSCNSRGHNSLRVKGPLCRSLLAPQPTKRSFSFARPF